MLKEFKSTDLSHVIRSSFQDVMAFITSPVSDLGQFLCWAQTKESTNVLVQNEMVEDAWGHVRVVSIKGTLTVNFSWNLRTDQLFEGTDLLTNTLLTQKMINKTSCSSLEQRLKWEFQDYLSRIHNQKLETNQEELLGS